MVIWFWYSKVKLVIYCVTRGAAAERQPFQRPAAPANEIMPYNEAAAFGHRQRPPPGLEETTFLI